MRPQVPEASWRKISEFGLGRGPLWETMSAFGPTDANPLLLGVDGDETSTLDHIGDALLDLGDRRDAIAASLRQAYARIDRYADGSRDIDLVTARLIAHAGIEPMMVAWLAAMCGGTLYIRDADRSALIDVDTQFKPHETRTCGTQLAIGDMASWQSCGTVLVDGIPDSIMVAAAGRPLSAIISHPVLDPLGLTIARVELAEGDGEAELQTDFEHVYPTVDELAGMEPSR